MKHFFKRNSTSVKPFKVKNKDLNVFYDSLWIFWWTLKIMGLLPFDFNGEDNAKFAWISLEVLYSLLIYGALCYPAFIAFTKMLATFFKFSLGLELMTHQASLLLVVFTFFYIPWTHWMEIRTVQSVFKKWRELQDDFDATTGEVIPKLKRKGTIVWTAVTVLFLIVGVRFGFSSGGIFFSLGDQIVVAYVMIVYTIHFTIYMANCTLVLLVIDGYKKHMQQAIEYRKFHQLARYNRVWVRIAELCPEIGGIFHKMYGSLLMAAFIGMTMNGYSTVKNGFDLRRLTGVFMMLFSFLLIHSFCKRGQRVATQIGENVIDELVKYRNIYKDEELEEEVEMFVDCILSVPYKVSVGGYVTVDRKLFISLTGTMITYLVVVVQFSYI